MSQSHTAGLCALLCFHWKLREGPRVAMPACPCPGQPRISSSVQRSSPARAQGRARSVRPAAGQRMSCGHCRSKQPAARQSWRRAGTQGSWLAAPSTAPALPLPFPWGCQIWGWALACRALAAWLQTELSQWQWKQQVTLEQATQHMHATARAKEKLQRSQEQLHALREQVGSRQNLQQCPWISLAPQTTQYMSSARHKLPRCRNWRKSFDVSRRGKKSSTKSCTRQRTGQAAF